MTRKEAIEALRGGIGCFPVTDRAVQVFDMAIKALEQEPCDDAISRQAAIDALKNLEDLQGRNVFTKNGLYPWNAIAQLPSVTPKQRTGHWIERPEIKTSAPEYLMFYECSECGDKQCFCKPDIHKKHFCINCGIKMIEPQESEEV